MRQNKTAGLSLVELMIAILLGLLVSSVVIQIYLSNKQTNQIQDGLARVQENGRYANYILGRDIRMAGYLGCNSTGTLKIQNNVRSTILPLPQNIDLNVGVRGYEGTASGFSPPLPGSLSYLNPLAGSDVIAISLLNFINSPLASGMANAASAIFVENRSNIKAGQIVFISDCNQGDLFVATNVSNAKSIAHGAKGNVWPFLSKAYDTDAKLTQYYSYVYYVADSSRKNAANEPIYSLYRRSVAISGASTTDTIEIAEGVEKMKISYGLDTNGDGSADTYLTASTIDDQSWINVVSVDINLLLASTEEINPAPQSYTFMGQTYKPSDRKLRRSWNIFIALRNRAGIIR